jgi:hypothetical protein
VKKSLANKIIDEFDLVRKLDDILRAHGAMTVDGARWTLSTLYGPLDVTVDTAGAYAVFKTPSKAYAHVADVRFPSGVWPHPLNLQDATGPVEAVQILSKYVARFAVRLRGVMPNLTTAVVSETKAPMSRTPK